MVEAKKVQKVVAYITQGNKLLVFRHTEYPEAGIQVPAGTIEAGETPKEAVMREVKEETGLIGLEIQAYLGEQYLGLTRFNQNERVQRHFYHLVLTSDTPARWRHYEVAPSDGSPAPIEFEFYWVEYPNEVPELSGEMGAYLARLGKYLHRRHQ